MRWRSHECTITIPPALSRLLPYIAMTQLAEIRPLLGRKIDPFFKSGHSINSRTSPCLVTDVTVDCSMVPTGEGEGAKNWRSRSWICASFCPTTCFYCPCLIKQRPGKRCDIWYVKVFIHPFVFISSVNLIIKSFIYYGIADRVGSPQIITILHKGVLAKWLQCYKGEGGLDISWW